MKIILSRKGFDSSSGGMPSPIFPDGKITSLPIPCHQSPSQIKSLRTQGKRLSKIIFELSKNRINSGQNVHLDPDIDFSALSNRAAHWRGAFGQAGAAQKHLANAKVGPGDLFLFFGWFKKIEKYQKIWRFKPKAPDLHVIYGWLWVDKVLSVYGHEKALLSAYPWLNKHPHLFGMDQKNNTIYIGSQHLPLSNKMAGYGVFNEICPIQILTDRQQNKRSLWKLPRCFYPPQQELALSYHQDMSRWKAIDKDWLNLSSVARGQEFILDSQYYPGIQDWLDKLFSVTS